MSEVISIPAGANFELVFKTIAKDINAMAAIFDLVDNSVDGINECRAAGIEDNFLIQLTFENDGFSIRDNGAAISRGEFEKRAMIIGEESGKEQVRLGKYGVGMKRAIYRIGARAEIESDTGHERITTCFGIEEVTTRPLEGIVTDSKKRGFYLKVGELNPQTKKEFQNSKWLDNLCDELSVRYGIFLTEFLAIKVVLPAGETKKIKSDFPEIRDREDLPIREVSDHDGDVKYQIKTGLLSDYVITSKRGVNKASVVNGTGLSRFPVS